MPLNPDDYRLTVIDNLLKEIQRDFLRKFDDKFIAEAIISWKTHLDRLKVPTKHIFPLYHFSLKVKEDGMNFSIWHMIKAWERFKSEYRPVDLVLKKGCPVCNGTGSKKILNQLTGEEVLQPCWYLHKD